VADEDASISGDSSCGGRGRPPGGRAGMAALSSVPMPSDGVWVPRGKRIGAAIGGVRGGARGGGRLQGGARAEPARRSAGVHRRR
jgi:hypothetical protein